MRKLSSILALSLALVSISCKNNALSIDETVTLAAIDKQEAKWNASGIKSYTFQQLKVCNCQSIAKAAITVTNGVITAATYTADGAPVPPGVRTQYLTVPELFALLRSIYAQKPAAFDVVYDEPLGYPAQIIVNVDPNSQIDDYVIQTTNFVRGSR